MTELQWVCVVIAIVAVAYATEWAFNKWTDN